MSIISLFSGSFCREEPVSERLLQAMNYRLVTDREIVSAASQLSGMATQKIERAFSSKASIFNRFTHEKERAVAFLQQALAGILGDDALLINGFCALLVPRTVSHVVSVCLIADLKWRSGIAARTENIAEKDATKLIHLRDEDSAAWANMLHKVRDPWDASLFDIVIPMDKTSEEEAAALVAQNMAKEVVRSTERSMRMVEDFKLAAHVRVLLIGEGHYVDVSASAGNVTLTINKNVLMLSRLEEELKEIVSPLPGVSSVTTRVGEGFHRADIYRRQDFEMPAKLLLVDDEREFVQTLSERLLLRNMGSAVTYDGESALSAVEIEEPDVMILDLKMPGIDGIEVLQRVKKTNPDVEVIILTGHGSEDDRRTCLELGAFAYLQKPVDIDLLSEKLKQANEKIRRKKGQAPAG
ncbi:MAG: response regulator [Planctomycetota bacterium]